MRVATWNIRDFRDDTDALRSIIQQLAPDVIALQETPRWRGFGWRTKRFARSCGLVHVVGGRTTGGPAILARPDLTITDTLAMRLPVSPWYAQARGLASLTLPYHSRRLAIASIHLPLVAQQRAEHAEIVKRVLRTRADEYLVAGDFNEPPGEPAWQNFASLATDSFPDAPVTFPASGPNTRIDAILTSPGLDPVLLSPPLDPATIAAATDHCPVIIELPD